MYRDYELRLGKNIKKLRKMRGLSQEHLAEKLQLIGCDISTYSLSRIEHGQKRVRALELKCLKEVLDITYDVLMEV